MLRFFFLLALSAWLGALLFFGVVAYVAFTVLPTTHEAGLVVGTSLRHLHVIGLVCGLVLLITQLLLRPQGRRRAFAAGLVLTAVMIALTVISQFAIIPAMDQHRARIGSTVDLNSVAPDNPDRVAFDQLHVYSTWVEDGVLVAALALLALASLSPHREP